MKTPRSCPLALLVLALWAPAASADCGDDPNNKLQTNNCDFDTDPSPSGTNGWREGNGTFSHNTTAGFPPAAANGSVDIAAIDLAAGANFWATSLELYGTMSAPTCAPITFAPGETAATAGIYVREISRDGVDPVTCTLNATYRSTAVCSGANVDMCTSGPVVLAPGSAWTLLSCDATALDTSAIRVIFGVSCGTEPLGFEVGHDNAFILPGTSGVPVELQYFTVE